MMKGDLASARASLEHALSLEPSPIALYYLGVLEAAEGKFTDALAHLERARVRGGNMPGVRAGLAYVYSHAGRKQAADSIMKSLAAAPDESVERGVAEAEMGDIDRAFASLTAVHWEDPVKVNAVPVAINLRASPLLAKFREDPRYPALLRKMGVEH
jgi:tetratricopeptide (TPR) repeat protein